MAYRIRAEAIDAETGEREAGTGVLVKRVDTLEDARVAAAELSRLGLAVSAIEPCREPSAAPRSAPAARSAAMWSSATRLGREAAAEAGRMVDELRLRWGRTARATR
ncbi:hypothetical protein N1F89_16485 [Aquibium sp. A9E412]|uniref:hypothetical protein n=1 Tax=Aquibium sp. A9E412 TaxID=2976767 RepID=UPI0025AFCF91|nr:hypothetical protein [Aquibium sp. A9E412]MDN2567821.1 hypothetical protein [Aquibium sp. A9E412]